MTAQLYVYHGGPTGHLAWHLNGDYVSFHPGKKEVDLGSCTFPLPSGVVTGHAYACEAIYLDECDDRAKYGSPKVYDLTNMDENTGAHLAGAFMSERLPYILWNPGEVGVINCVTTSILLLTVMLPEALPQAWDLKWGGVIRDIRRTDAGDWIGAVIQEPLSTLMHVRDVEALAIDWIKSVECDDLPAPAPLPRVVVPPVPRPPDKGH